MTRSNRECGIDRRTFLQGIAVGAATAPLASLAAQDQAPKSRVIVAERDAFADDDVDPKAVKQAVDAMVIKLSGKSNIDEAWRTFVSPKETVALKFNGLFKRASTSPELIWAVCRGLVDAGLAEDKIIIFDRKLSDFDTAGIKPFEDMPKIRRMGADSGWDAEVKAGPFKTKLSKVITQEADAMINLSRMKHHVIAGVTLTLKNHLGSVPNPGDFHKHIDAVAELNALEPIAKKTRLTLCDAMVGIFDQGPQFRGKHWTWPAKSLLAATDVVALDAVGADMLRKARMAKGKGPTKPDPSHIAHAAEIGLGTADLQKIDVIKV
ncbi:MAG: DUF362 domain-containing protein [Phycisphaerae bacterium]|nr:DUF362 domain-containing protein [Phycisphaerae bacterium]